MAGLGRLTIDLVANTGQFEKAMGSADRVTRQNMRRVSRQLRSAERDAAAATASLRRLGMQFGLVASASLAVVTREVSRLADKGDEIAKLSKQLGMGAEAIQEMGFAAEQSGSNMQSFVRATAQMQRNLQGAADGLSTQQRAFERIGVSVRDLQGLSPEDQFARIATALSGMGDATQRNASALEIFGRSAGELIPMLLEGEAGLMALREQLRETGSVMSTEAAHASEVFNDQLNILGHTLQGFKTRIFEDAIGPLAEFSQFLNSEEGAEAMTKSLEALKLAAIAVGGVLGVRMVGQLAAASIQLAVATKQVVALTAAKMGYAGATQTATVATIGLRSALTTVLGPISMTIMALSAVAYSVFQMKDAWGDAVGEGESLDDLLGRLADSTNELSMAQAAAAKAQLGLELVRLRKEYREGAREIEELGDQIIAMNERIASASESRAGTGSGNWGVDTVAIDEARVEGMLRQYQELSEARSRAGEELAEVEEAMAKIEESLSGGADSVAASASAASGEVDGFARSLAQLEARLDGNMAAFTLAEHITAAGQALARGEINAATYAKAVVLYMREAAEAVRGEQERIASEAMRAAQEVADFERQIRSMQASLNGPVSVAVDRAQIERERALARATEMFGDNAEKFREVSDVINAVYVKAVKGAIKGTEELTDATDDTAAAQESMLRWMEDIEAQVAGPTDVALLKHARRMREINELYAGNPEMLARGLRASTAQLNMDLRQVGDEIGNDIGDGVGDAIAQSVISALQTLDGASLGKLLGDALRTQGARHIQKSLEDTIGNPLKDIVGSALRGASSALGGGELSDEMVAEGVAVGMVAIGQALDGDYKAAIGTAIGAALGTVLPGGPAVWGTIGGIVGGMFEKDPILQVSGRSGFSRDPDEAVRRGDYVDTDLGQTVFRFRKIDSQTQQEVKAAISEFDEMLASTIESEGQMDAARAAVDALRYVGEGDDMSLADAIEQRFDAVLGTFDDFTQAVVNRGSTLEDRVQRFQDMFNIEKVIDLGQGFAGIERTIELVDGLGVGVETLADTFQRLLGNFNNYAAVMQGIEEGIELAPLSGFQRGMVTIRRELSASIKALNDNAKATGLNGARTEDLARAHEWAAIRVAATIDDLVASSQQLADSVFGSPIDSIQEQIDNLVDPSLELADATNEGRDALLGFLQGMMELAGFADSLLVGDKSPLGTREQLPLAMENLREAIANNDAQGAQSAANQALEIARERYASGAEYQRIFAEVQELLRGAAAGAGVELGEVEAEAEDAQAEYDSELERLLAEREALEAERADREQRSGAMDLAQNVADIAQASGDSFEEIADRIGFDLAELGEVLGMDATELDDFLTGMQVDTDVIADGLDALRVDLLQALADLPRAFEQYDPNAPTNTPPEPNEPGYTPPGDDGTGANGVNSADANSTASFGGQIDRLIAETATPTELVNSSARSADLLQRLVDNSERSHARSTRTAGATP